MSARVSDHANGGLRAKHEGNECTDITQVCAANAVIYEAKMTTWLGRVERTISLADDADDARRASDESTIGDRRPISARRAAGVDVGIINSPSLGRGRLKTAKAPISTPQFRSMESASPSRTSPFAAPEKRTAQCVNTSVCDVCTVD